MALSFNQQLCYILGYTARQFDPRYTSNPIILPNYTADDIAYMQAIIDKLTSVNLELETNRKDSMALSVGEVKVDFNRNMQITKAEGSRLLRELEQVSGVKMVYDRYMGRKPSDGSVTPLAVRNYS